MKKIARLIIKYPVKTLLFTLLIILISIVGVYRVGLNTGNDTLITDETEIYLDNEAYQMEFGKDPIIILVEHDDPFNQQSIELLYQMHEKIKTMDGIFSLNSPVTLLEQMTIKLFQESQLGLINISAGLAQTGNQLSLLSSNVSSSNQTNNVDLQALMTLIQSLVVAQNQLGLELIDIYSMIDQLILTTDQMILDLSLLAEDLEGDLSRVDELEITNQTLLDLEDLKSNLTIIDQTSSSSNIPAQTTQALESILLNMNTLSVMLGEKTAALTTLSAQLSMMGASLTQISTNLSMISSNFNAFEPGFPESEETLQMLLYDENGIRAPFQSFIIDENKIRMVIVLEYDITDQEVDAISEALFEVVEDMEMSETVLISGKPILDRSIKSSMMDSMQLMMLSSVVMMILILLFVYNVRLKLFPIFMILIVVIATIGIMGWFNIGLTMVSMAVFPVLIGLGIDYFIQFQTRYEEERRG